MIADRDVLTFRQGYYDLFVSLFWREPAGALLAALAGGIRERVEGARRLHPLLGEGWEDIGEFLKEVSPERLAETVADEFTRLFIGPRDPAVTLYESYYLTGRLLDRPLAILRSFLEQIGLEKDQGYPEPEDFLAFELEVMRHLISRQASAQDPDESVRWLAHQATFLKEHLLVWGPAAAKDISEASGAFFYRGVARLLHGFLELERDLFKPLGPEHPKSLEEGRQSFSGVGGWKGPLLDFSAASGPVEESREA